MSKTEAMNEEFIVALEEPEHAYACIVDDPLYDGNTKEINNFYRRNSGKTIMRVSGDTARDWMSNYIKKYRKGTA